MRNPELVLYPLKVHSVSHTLGMLKYFTFCDSARQELTGHLRVLGWGARTLEAQSCGLSWGRPGEVSIPVRVFCSVSAEAVLLVSVLGLVPGLVELAEAGGRNMAAELAPHDGEGTEGAHWSWRPRRSCRACSTRPRLNVLWVLRESLVVKIWRPRGEAASLAPLVLVLIFFKFWGNPGGVLGMSWGRFDLVRSILELFWLCGYWEPVMRGFWVYWPKAAIRFLRSSC